MNNESAPVRTYSDFKKNEIERIDKQAGMLKSMIAANEKEVIRLNAENAQLLNQIENCSKLIDELTTV
jgi:peptidoglycan hydrolase CwlO-like protein